MYTIWGRPNCVWCNEAKKLLDYYFIPFKYIELTSENLDEFTILTNGAKKVPQVFHKTGELIGGYEELNKFLSSTS